MPRLSAPQEFSVSNKRGRFVFFSLGKQPDRGAETDARFVVLGGKDAWIGQTVRSALAGFTTVTV